MILNDITIKSMSLVRNAIDGGYKVASYDLTVEHVVTPDGKVVSEHELAPQGMVKVISRETITLPANITAYVHVKTGLCNQGVLALNIGIVDPCFSGPLQSTLINFGKKTYFVKSGSVFGRITFHKQVEPETNPKPMVRSMEEVLESAKADVDRYLAADFLNFSKTVKKAAAKAAQGLKFAALAYIPFLAILLTFFTFFLNSSNMSKLESYVKDRASEGMQVEEMAVKIKALELDRDKLASDRDRLEQDIQRLRDHIDNPPLKAVHDSIKH